jgi:NADH dehydrogenase
VDPATGQAVPGVAQGALQEGGFVAELIRDSLGGRSLSGTRRTFRYKDKGNLATIGRAKAVADLGGRTITGFPAWVLWSAVHILFLVGFRNKILVMVNWLWQWLIQGRGARLITGFPEVNLTRQADL